MGEIMADETKRGVGRPTDYDPTFCSALIEHMGKGASFEAFAGVLGVSKQSLYTWFGKYPDFMDAKKIGEAKSLLFWERIGIDGLWEETGKDASGMKLNTSNWIFQMKNRHKWKDRQDVDINHNDTQLIERERLSRMPMNELEALVIKNLEAKKE